MAPPAVGTLGLLTLAGWFGVNGLPLLEEQHQTQLAGWRAVQEVEREASECGQMVVMESELHLFASYFWHFQERLGLQTPYKVLSPRTPEPWAGIDRSFLLATVHEQLYLPSLSGGRKAWGGVSPRLEPLTQQRFLDAVVLDNPPLPVGQWWARSALPDGRFFMWGGVDAELWLAPVPAGTWIGVEVKPAPGDASLVVALNGGDSVEIPGRSERRWLWFARSAGSDREPVVITMARARGYSPGVGDDRPLSVQVSGVAVHGPGTVLGGEVASLSDRGMLGLEVEGCFGAEGFGDAGGGVWLASESRWRMAVGEPGLLTLRLMSPRPTSPHARVVVEGRVVVDEVDFSAGPAEVVILVSSDDVLDRKLEIDISSEPYVPAEAGHGDDRRNLGVVFLRLEFEPLAPPQVGWWTPESGR